MVFSSLEFIFVFLPIVILLYGLLAKIFKPSSNHYFTILNAFLLIASLYFYIRGEKKLFWVMILSSLIDYLASYIIGREYEKNSNSNHTNRKQKIAFWFAIISNLSMLCFFKYANWGYSTFLEILNSLGVDTSLHFVRTQLSIVLPIGISFYTFQTMSYTIDVYRRQITYSKNIIDYMSYVTFFPQLIAGPIVRYIDVKNQLVFRTHNLQDFVSGFQRFTLGLAKKVIVANPMGYYADYIFSLNTASFDAVTAWVGALAYTLQIYFDFSGYSDMAIGLGRIFGFHFPENFNYPYIAKSVQDFWRRWHISLSTWFRDYLYIPLGGNRNGLLKEYRNLFAIFIICGFWHGANFTFIAWGAFHGLFLTIERFLRSYKYNSLSPKWIAHLYTMMVVIFGWVLFRSDTLTQAWNYWLAMCGANSWWNDQSNEILQIPHFVVYAFLGIICSAPNIFFQAKISRSFGLYILLFILTACILTGQDYNPFIYFRF